jgi:RNA polymerase sigma factor (sigma-70 family)
MEIDYLKLESKNFSKQDVKDVENVQRFVEEGDLKSFNKIYNKYFKIVSTIVNGYRNISSDVRGDLISEIMIKIHNNLHKYSPNGKFSNWVIRLTKNYIYDKLRNKSYKENYNMTISKDEVFENNESSSSNYNYLQLSDDSENVEDSLISLELKEELNSKIKLAISKFNDLEREVFNMRIYDGLSFKEISNIINKDINYCLSKFHRAKKKIQKEL